jgi:hypothetical protein
MASKKMKKQMFDYLVSKLEEGGQVIDPQQSEIQGINTSYIKLPQEKGLIMMIDQPFTQQKYITFRGSAINQGYDFLPIFLKDGKTYFRSKAQKNNFKKDKSLKHYNSEDLRRIISARPEERAELRKTNNLHYYQPDSDRLDEMVRVFTFAPVRFDYSHVTSDKFQPENTDSKTLKIWKKEESLEEGLRYENGILISAPKPVIRRSIQGELF